MFPIFRHMNFTFLRNDSVLPKYALKELYTLFSKMLLQPSDTFSHYRFICQGILELFLGFVFFSFFSKSPETAAVKSKTVKTRFLNLIRLKSAEIICGKVIPDYFYDSVIHQCKMVQVMKYAESCSIQYHYCYVGFFFFFCTILLT